MVLSDVGTEIGNLASGLFGDLVQDGVDAVVSTAGALDLTAAQAGAAAGANAGVKFSAPSGDDVVLSDVGTEIGNLASGLFGNLVQDGVDAVTSTAGALNLTAAQAGAAAGANAGVKFSAPAGNVVSITDTSSDIEALTQQQLIELNNEGITAITSIDGGIQFDVQQAIAVSDPVSVRVPNGFTVTVADTAATIETLTPQEIGELGSLGFTNITATDATLKFDVAQALAAQSANFAIHVPSGDTLEILDTAANLQALTPQQIAALQAIGVTSFIDSAGAPPPSPSPGPDFSTVFTGDFDGNSQPDLVFQRPSDGATEILLGSGLTFSGGILSNPGVQNASLNLVGVGDFNGDGNADLVFLNPGTATPVIQFLNGTTPIGGGPPSVNTFDPSFTIVGVGDFNGDGKADLVWHRASDGVSEIQFLNGTTSIGGGVINSPGFNADWQIVGVGDFNGDGHSDLVFHRASDGLTEIQFLNGTTPIGGGVINDPTFQTPDWQVVEVGDFNGDGHPDLVFHDTATSVTAIEFLNGLTPIGGGVINNTAFQTPDWQVAGVGDFNGDGHPDLVFHDTVTGVTEIQLLNGITPIGGGPIVLH